MDRAEIIAAIESMTVLELAELVKELEEKFGVSAAAPVAVAAAPAAAAAAEPAEEKTEFDVILKEVGADKIKVIKVVREVDVYKRQPPCSPCIMCAFSGMCRCKAAKTN